MLPAMSRACMGRAAHYNRCRELDSAVRPPPICRQTREPGSPGRAPSSARGTEPVRSANGIRGFEASPVHRGESEIRIVDIALLPDYRGNGIGTALLRDLFSEADAAGKTVTIHVERFNPALRLYERLGFSVAEDKGVYLFLERRPAM
jgi:ribosomal protein S18 acetylase RimI-like enzyme